MYNWKNIDNRWYYYIESTGRVVGVVHYFALQTICNCYIYSNDTPYVFTEKSLGLYVEMDMARKAVERFWQIEDSTLPLLS
jgi:hypothetical protein